VAKQEKLIKQEKANLHKAEMAATTTTPQARLEQATPA
jgi:hypothetical protein